MPRFGEASLCLPPPCPCSKHAVSFDPPLFQQHFPGTLSCLGQAGNKIQFPSHGVGGVFPSPRVAVPQHVSPSPLSPLLREVITAHPTDARMVKLACEVLAAIAVAPVVKLTARPRRRL